jgi:predicted O-methyltransferase YrrM
VFYTAAEPQTVELLVSLVKALRPRYVIETGTLRGDTARAIGGSLDIGHLDTIDTDDYGVVFDGPVSFCHMDSRDFIPDRPIDLAFLDSDPNIRFEEAEHFRPFLAPDGLIAIHDSRDFGRPDDWRWVQIPTPRGLLLLQDA